MRVDTVKKNHVHSNPNIPPSPSRYSQQDYLINFYIKFRKKSLIITNLSKERKEKIISVALITI